MVPGDGCLVRRGHRGWDGRRVTIQCTEVIVKDIAFIWGGGITLLIILSKRK